MNLISVSKRARNLSKTFTNLIRDRWLRNQRKSPRIFEPWDIFKCPSSSRRAETDSPFFSESHSSLPFWSFAFTRVLASRMSAQVTTINHREVYLPMDQPHTTTDSPRTVKDSQWWTRPTNSKSRSQLHKTRATTISWASCTGAIKSSQRPKEKSIKKELQWMAWRLAGSERSSLGAYLHYLTNNEHFNRSDTF